MILDFSLVEDAAVSTQSQVWRLQSWKEFGRVDCRLDAYASFAAVFRRPFMSVYAVSISFLSAVALTLDPGLSFTWRMNLPAPSNRPSGSAISAPRKNPKLT